MLSKCPDRRVLIFGGAGFIGSNWGGRLLQETEAHIHVFDNLSRSGSRHNIAWLQRLAGNTKRLKISIEDIRDALAVRKAVSDATEIYQFAAQVAVTSSVQDPRNDIEVNLLGTFNVLEAVRQSGNQPFLLFTSTNKVYGNCARTPEAREIGTSERQPLDFHSPYGCSKGSADQYVRDYGRIYHLPTVVLRMSCIAGPRQFGTEDQGWVAHFLYSALQDAPLTIYGDGHQVRDVLHVDDLLDAFNLVWENLPNTREEIFNIGGGPNRAVSLMEVIEKVHALTGRHLDLSWSDARPGDQQIYVTDFAKLRSITKWEPKRTFDETLASILAWAETNPELLASQQSRESISATTGTA